MKLEFEENPELNKSHVYAFISHINESFDEEDDDIKKIDDEKDKPVETQKQKLTFSSFNKSFAMNATRAFGSMTTFYIFCIWALIPLIPLFSKQKDAILYISSGFIQLVALPLILVGQDLLNDASEERIKRTEEIVNKSSTDIKQVIKSISVLDGFFSDELKEHVQKTAEFQQELVQIQTKLASDIAELKKSLKISE
jgi:uncharacterized membrane protein